MMNPQEKTARRYEKPVPWLFGAQLTGRLKGALLYAAYGKKLDPRDWMTAEVLPFDQGSKEEFWFDYVSDTGDGTKAMYSIAYMAMTNLWTKLTVADTSLPVDRAVTTLKKDEDGFTFQLPRGEFLFFGGDTAYHAAEYLSLVNRVQHPFNYAYEDLLNRGLISNDDERRPIIGIPGNHDYYDQIDGFRRQFRRPVREETPPLGRANRSNAELSLPGFKRIQEASYVALQLPFGWWLWGLDTESISDRLNQHLDRRQEHFFLNLPDNHPDKLIVATCTPSTVEGRFADEDNPKVARPMKALKIKRPFLPSTDLKNSGQNNLDVGQCRLDISGDVHHYARYWGPDASGNPRKHTTAPRPAAASYASVVSGSGGAFHHPTTTYDNEICEQVLYPPEDASREIVADRIFKFWNVFTGGRVWVAGLIMAVTVFFAATVVQSSKQFLGSISLLTKPSFQIVNPQRIQPVVHQLEPCGPLHPFGLWSGLGLAPDERPAPCSGGQPVYYFASEQPRPIDLVLGQLAISLAVILIVATLYLSVFTKKIFTGDSPFDTDHDPAKPLWPIIIVTAVLVLIGFASVKPYHDHITPFCSSLIVLFAIFAAITAVVLSLRYGEYRFNKSFVPDRGGSRWLEIVCWIMAVSVLACGLWFFGKNNLPAMLISDIVFVTVLLTTVAAVILLPFKVTDDLFYTNSKGVGIVGKSALAIWHLVLQLFVPYILLTHGNWLVWLVAAVLLVLPNYPAQFLLKKDKGVLLFLLWIVYGAVMLTLPWIITSLFGPIQTPSLFTNPIGLTPVLFAAVIAAVLGAIISCLWTGWYFGVAFAFNGHNNEVGGAARVEQFKQFIRFRLTAAGLTGYVIAIDDPSKIDEVDSSGHKFDGSDLTVKLIDVFHLAPKKGVTP